MAEDTTLTFSQFLDETISYQTTPTTDWSVYWVMRYSSADKMSHDAVKLSRCYNILINWAQRVSVAIMKLLQLLAEITSFKTAPSRKWQENLLMRCKFSAGTMSCDGVAKRALTSVMDWRKQKLLEQGFSPSVLTCSSRFIKSGPRSTDELFVF